MTPWNKPGVHQKGKKARGKVRFESQRDMGNLRRRAHLRNPGRGKVRMGGKEKHEWRTEELCAFELTWNLGKTVFRQREREQADALIPRT